MFGLPCSSHRPKYLVGVGGVGRGRSNRWGINCNYCLKWAKPQPMLYESKTPSSEEASNGSYRMYASGDLYCSTCSVRLHCTALYVCTAALQTSVSCNGRHALLVFAITNCVIKIYWDVREFVEQVLMFNQTCDVWVVIILLKIERTRANISLAILK